MVDQREKEGLSGREAGFVALLRGACWAPERLQSEVGLACIADPVVPPAGCRKIRERAGELREALTTVVEEEAVVVVVVVVAVGVGVGVVGVERWVVCRLL